MNFADIKVANGKMGFDSPMTLHAQISHNTNCELVVWYVNCFTIISSNNGWRPPTNMLYPIKTKRCLLSCTKKNK